MADFITGMTIRELQGVVDIQFKESRETGNINNIRDIWWDRNGKCHALVRNKDGSYYVEQIHEIRQNSEVIWSDEEETNG